MFYRISAAAHIGGRITMDDCYGIRLSGQKSKRLMGCAENCACSLIHNLANGSISAAVADGMGGALEGAFSAQEVVKKATKFCATFPSQEILRLHSEWASVPKERHSGQTIYGTTLTHVSIQASHGRIFPLVEVNSVGDSPVFLVRDGKLTLLNELDNLAFRRLKDPERDYEGGLPESNKLYKFFGCNRIKDTELFCSLTLKLKESDSLLLCTDGLLALRRSEIEDIIASTASSSNTAIRLVEEAIKVDSADNTSAILIEPLVEYEKITI